MENIAVKFARHNLHIHKEITLEAIKNNTYTNFPNKYRAKNTQERIIIMRPTSMIKHQMTNKRNANSDYSL